MIHDWISCRESQFVKSSADSPIRKSPVVSISAESLEYCLWTNTCDETLIDKVPRLKFPPNHVYIGLVVNRNIDQSQLNFNPILWRWTFPPTINSNLTNYGFGRIQQSIRIIYGLRIVFKPIRRGAEKVTWDYRNMRRTWLQYSRWR